MSANQKPVLGAALSINSLPAHREWLLSRQRDLELQDFFRAEVLDGDWRSVADRVKRHLDGFEGRLGIHGPFWGFKIDSPISAISISSIQCARCESAPVTPRTTAARLRSQSISCSDEAATGDIGARTVTASRSYATQHHSVPEGQERRCALAIDGALTACGSRSA